MKKVFKPIYIILFLGFFLRILSINQSFWLDEATSANVARNLNLTEIITKFSVNDFHPPFYYFLLKVWTVPFGISEVSTRILSLLLGLATINVAYLVGKLVSNRNLGLISALLVATSPLHVYYSQEARMYVLVTFLVLMSFYFFLKMLGKPGFFDWLFFSLSLVLIASSDYLALVVFPCFWIIALVKKKRIGWWTSFLSCHIPLAVFIAWWLPFFSRQFLSGLAVRESVPSWWGILGGFSLKEVFLVPVKFLIGRVSFESNFVYGLVLFLVAFIFGLSCYVGREAFKKHKDIVIFFFASFLFSVFISFKVPVLSYFRLLFLLPFFYLLISLALERVKQRHFFVLFFLICIVNISFSLAYLLNPKFQREDWRGFSRYVEEQSQGKNSIVLFPANSQMEAYNYYREDSEPGVEAKGPEGFADSFEQIWLMRYVQDIFDPRDELRQKVENFDYSKTEEKNFNGVVVWRYQK